MPRGEQADPSAVCGRWRLTRRKRGLTVVYSLRDRTCGIATYRDVIATDDRTETSRCVCRVPTPDWRMTRDDPEVVQSQTTSDAKGRRLTVWQGLVRTVATKKTGDAESPKHPTKSNPASD